MSLNNGTIVNRLTSLNTNRYTFGCTGLGDRLLQNAGGAFITDTLDLSASSDGGAEPGAGLKTFAMALLQCYTL